MEREKKTKNVTISSGTSGAIPVRNDKGEISMQKVKVKRYVAGKRPDYAPSSESDDNDDNDDQEEEEKEQEKHQQQQQQKHRIRKEAGEEESDDDIDENTGVIRSVATSSVAIVTSSTDDRRLQRLAQQTAETSASTSSGRARTNRHSTREIAEPVILEEASSEVVSRVPENYNEEEETEVDDDERARRRAAIKQRALQKRKEELATLEEEQQKQQKSKKASSDESDGDDSGDSDDSDDESDGDSDEDSSSEYESDDDDSDENAMPRLKPVFVRKQDRVTIEERRVEEEKEKVVAKERELLHMEAKKETRKIIEEEVTREKNAERARKHNDKDIVCDFDTDDDEKSGESAYEAWKLRELKRIKRDRDERERFDKEKQEIQRVRSMTDDERALYLQQNPKSLINQAQKGKYKFMQKYFHRGAFFMDEDDEVFKRNFAEPTLEDHFDKTILPKVMQVKNFGMSGRTKYTHLLDQDTTRLDDNPWANQEKNTRVIGGGTKQVFDKPSVSKKSSK